jgi:sugar phosphate permease
MGFAYPGIGVGGATVPRVSHALVQHFGWQVTRRSPGVLVVLLSLPFAFFVKEAPPVHPPIERHLKPRSRERSRPFLSIR